MGFRKARLKYGIYGIMIVGIILVWYSYHDPSPLLVIGIGAILGPIYTLIRGYTATNISIMFAVVALSGVVGSVYTQVTDRTLVWSLSCIVIGLAAGMQAIYYWRIRPWELENSDW